MRAILAGLALALLIASPVLAAKGTHGKPAAPIPGSATLIATPNPATVGATVRVEGCGYVFGGAWMPPVQLDVIAPDGSVESFGLGLFADGCIAGTNVVPDAAGTWTLHAVQGGVVAGTTTFVAA